MRKAAIILATAAVFDLGVMAVAAQAQQQTREPPRSSGPGAGQGTAPSGSEDIFKQSLSFNYQKIDFEYTAQACIADRGEVVRREGGQQCRLGAPGRPTAGANDGASGLAVQDPTGPGGNGGCIPGLPNSGGSTGPCTGAPVAISDQGVDGGLVPWRSTARPQIKLREEYFFLKIDAALPLRACIARRGEVVTHEGSQQCRLPAAEAPAIGNPTRNLPGGIPPRH